MSAEHEDEVEEEVLGDEANDEAKDEASDGGSDESSEEASDGEFDDPPGYVDDIPDGDLLADLLKDQPVEETGLQNIIVVDNAPKVGADRMAKLQSILNKVFGRFGKIVTQDYPVDEEGVFKGYFFLELSTPEEAVNAVKAGNGYRLDKSHIFKVNFLSDFEKYSNVPEQWEQPERTEFKEIGNLRSWLHEENCFDQCAVMYNQGGQVAIAQSTPQELKVVTERDRWTEADLHWSPLGSYLATIHKLGVALWGTAKFSRIFKFEHQGVQHIAFSPRERYMVTFSNVVDDVNNPQHIMIWDVKTGAKKRSFMKVSAEGYWPIIKWSHNENYFARMSENLLSVYSVPSFGLLDKKSIVVKGIRDFSWSPADDKIVYWVLAIESIPAKITIIDIPSRKEICTKSRHDVSECKIQWHKQGDYLCVMVDHWMTKTKKQKCHSFEIFHIREPDVPVDTVEIKEDVHSFALEPQGSKFGVVHGDPPTRISASFYAINNKGYKVSKITTLERRLGKNIFWSPAGQFLVLAGLKEMGGQLEFYDSNDFSLMNAVEHSSASDLEWDPTGRYVVTSVSFWNQKVDTGFYVWSFQGRPLYRSPAHIEKFCQFLWRPRPPSILTEEDLKTIRKDYKKYHHAFEAKDRTTKTKASKDLIEKRKKARDKFMEFRRKKEAELKMIMEDLAQDVDLSGDEEEEVEYEEETMEFLEREDVELIVVPTTS